MSFPGLKFSNSTIPKLNYEDLKKKVQIKPYNFQFSSIFHSQQTRSFPNFTVYRFRKNDLHVWKLLSLGSRAIGGRLKREFWRPNSP